MTKKSRQSADMDGPRDDVGHDAGDPEPTELEVQQMLEAADRSPLAEDAANAPATPTPNQAVVQSRDAAIASVVAAGLPHALDLAPVNSKIVVTKDGAVLATPAHVALLDPHDVANRLPTGARIQKREQDGAVAFHAEQLDPAITRPVLVTTSAMAAIAGFLPHFHPSGLPR